jgi:hypothetical protein
VEACFTKIFVDEQLSYSHFQDAENLLSVVVLGLNVCVFPAPFHRVAAIPNEPTKTSLPKLM